MARGRRKTFWWTGSGLGKKNWKARVGVEIFLPRKFAPLTHHFYWFFTTLQTTANKHNWQISFPWKLIFVLFKSGLRKIIPRCWVGHGMWLPFFIFFYIILSAHIPQNDTGYVSCGNEGGQCYLSCCYDMIIGVQVIKWETNKSLAKTFYCGWGIEHTVVNCC